MDAGTQDRLIAQITWGRLWFENDSKTLILRTPTLAEQASSARKYATALKLATANQLLTNDERIRLAVERGEWTFENDAKMESLKTDIRTLKRGMLDYVFQTDRLEVARRMVRKAEEVFCELANHRTALLVNTAEHFATMSEQRYIVGRVTLDEEERQIWPRLSDADSCEDFGLLDALCRLYFDTSRLKDSVFRELARSTSWRSAWSVMTKTGSMFSGHPTEWSYNQKQLAYWSEVYRSVHEAWNRPSDKVLEDDDLLDSWFIRQGDESEKRINKSMIESVTGVKGAKKQAPGSFQETFVFTDRAGASQVYGMNDLQGRIQIRRRQEEMARKGPLEEQQFRIVQQDMAMQAQQAFAGKLRKSQ